MKKIIVIIGLIILTGCSVEKINTVGNYKEGTYTGTAIDNYGGSSNTATAVVNVNSSGVITSVYLDTTYTKDGIVTTKKALGYDYNMKGVSASIGKIEGGAEWFEQVVTLEKKIVEEQGTSWLKWSDSESTKTDSVAGVTIKIDALYEALTNALEQAKK